MVFFDSNVNNVNNCFQLKKKLPTLQLEALQRHYNWRHYNWMAFDGLQPSQKIIYNAISWATALLKVYFYFILLCEWYLKLCSIGYSNPSSMPSPGIFFSIKPKAWSKHNDPFSENRYRIVQGLRKCAAIADGRPISNEIEFLQSNSKLCLLGKITL